MVNFSLCTEVSVKLINVREMERLGHFCSARDG